MTSLWISREHMVLRKYGVSGIGTKTVVKIEIEVNDPHELGFLLRDLEDAKRAADNKRKAQAQAAKAGKQRKLGHEKPLLIPYFGEDGR